MRKCRLILSTGEVFNCGLIGRSLVASGELVFTTGMVGYSEAMSDPSYCGQILVFSFPLVGNYGVPSKQNYEDDLIEGHESSKIHASAIVVSEYEENPHHRTCEVNLDRWLSENNVPGLVGLDTRRLVQIVRDNKKVLAKIIPSEVDGFLSREEISFKESMDETVFFDPADYNLLPLVSSRSINEIGSGDITVGIVDCGVKWNIVREVIKSGCKVKVIPWDKEISEVDCDAFLISNGPGDPIKYKSILDEIKNIIDRKKPLLGICLGHQLISLACGYTTSRMEYSHRSHNQPVIDLVTERCYVTSQNHGYVVDDVEVENIDKWFTNANDNSVEGIISKDKKIRSVQFHPEASSGPRDTIFVIKDFIKFVSEGV